MLSPTPPPRPGLKLSLEWEVFPLVAEVREAVLATHGPACAAALLAAAPPLACQRLADLCADAGPLTAPVRDKLSSEDRLILDIVISTFPPARAGFGDFDYGVLVDDALILGAV